MRSIHLPLRAVGHACGGSSILFSLTTSLVFFSTTFANAAPPPPHGGHPRIYLAPATLDAMKAKVPESSSGAARAIAKCKKVETQPKDFESEWGPAAMACGLAYQLTKDAAYLASGTKMLNALLDDYQTIGDKAGGDEVVRHDSGYYIRIHGPYAGLAYDWLNEGLAADAKAHARTRFKAWIDWYTKDGYLNDEPGSNYHAGYVFAKTLISIASAGEDDGSADAWFVDVHDNLFKTQLIGKGLAAPSSVLVGGDWSEGWQYGPLSVLEYALATRAMEEQGAQLPEMRAWASDLALAYLHALPPKRNGVFTNSDLDRDEPLARLNPRPFLAVAGGMASDQATSWALQGLKLPSTEKSTDEVFDALAEARNVPPADFAATNPSRWYLVKGTRKLLVRSAWDENAMWAVFVSAPNLVPDHNHPDASNFAFVRGGDHLIVDPSPYGSLSSLTANAITVDSNTVGQPHRPGQSVWNNRSELPWARATVSGIAAARADLHGAFNDRDDKSDVPFARREWVFLPEGEIITIDRARTDDANRKLHVRFRTPADLTAPEEATRSGSVGASNLFIHTVKLSGGAANQRSVAVANDCGSGDWGVCDKARFKVTEYFADVPGPEAFAVHVIDGVGTGEPAAVVKALDTVDPANATVIGASILRGGTQTYVAASSAKDGAAGASLTYTVPGDISSRHVTFDAPEDAQGQSKVEMRADGGKCVATITAGAGFTGRPLVFTIKSAAEGCLAVEDKGADPGSAPPGAGPDGTARPENKDGAPAEDVGCGCNIPSRTSMFTGGAAIAALVAAVALRRRRRRHP